MATPTVTNIDTRTKRIQWVLTTADPIGTPYPYSCNFPDKSVHTHGTWGGATCVIQGSNEGTAPADLHTLTDPSPAALSFTGNGLKQILENTIYIGPTLSVTGTGATVIVDMMLSVTHR